MKLIQFDMANYIESVDFADRVTAWNQAEARRHLSATMRWADKLSISQFSGTKRLPIAHWWAGDPYGKRPESVATWTNRMARENPPQSFRYRPNEINGPQENKHDYPLPNSCMIKRARSVEEALSMLRKFGVSPEQVITV